MRIGLLYSKEVWGIGGTMSKNGSIIKMPWKFKIVGALCLYSLIMFAYMPGVDRMLCVVAMFLSAVGDLFLAHVFSLKKRRNLNI